MGELKEAVKEYLSLRRALGFELCRPGRLLHKFALFAEQQDASFITTELALRWAIQPKGVQPFTWAERLGVVRRFAQYRIASDPRTEIPSQELLPYRYQRKQPYIYNDDEITQLLEAAKHLESPTGLRSSTYSTLFGLLAATGMRISEPIALDSQDVDTVNGILTIRRTKFGKSRLIPIHSSTQSKLRQYASLRDQVFSRPRTPSFFVSDRGMRLVDYNVRWTFVKLSRQIGLRGLSDSNGPRLHDLRHRFAVKTLLHWYRTGADVETHMPQLATYLGHVHVNDTYWYLSAIPELLEFAILRLDQPEGGSSS
jgi:site-specific recombinase XerD